MAKKKRRRAIEKHPLFDYQYEDDVTFECPVRGTVTQKVTVTRFKSKLQAAREAMMAARDEFDELLDGDELLDDEEYEDEE